jgi:hypothetical protein
MIDLTSTAPYSTAWNAYAGSDLDADLVTLSTTQVSGFGAYVFSSSIATSTLVENTDILATDIFYTFQSDCSYSVDHATKDKTYDYTNEDTTMEEVTDGTVSNVVDVYVDIYQGSTLCSD